MAEAIKYKDHAVVYGDGKGTDAAYINESFKGILRLSPNSSTTFNNASTAIGSGYTAFQDAIEDALKVQYISVSTSDGIILDMRISTHGVEYTNLNVLGNLFADEIQLYIKNFVFNLGSQIEMPINTNNLISINSLGTNYTYEPVNFENVDGCYFLMNESTKKRKFIYKNANDIVDLFINEKLLEIDMIPAGSIHFVPIGPAEYKELKDANGGDSAHNKSSKGIDTLIRDYLPCDGKEYSSDKFPELAKILYGTNVTYWDNSGNRKIYENGSVSGKFRVPDLRGQFIRSINNMGIESSKTEENGTWEIDSTIEMERALKNAVLRGDSHYHYITLDSFTGAVEPYIDDIINRDNDGNITTNDKRFTIDSQRGVIKGTAAPMARLGNITTFSRADRSVKWGNCNCDKGTWGIYSNWPILGTGTSWYSDKPAYGDSVVLTSYGPNCGYILSVISNYNCVTRSINDLDWVGLSSGSIPAEVNDVAIDNLNYTKQRKSKLDTNMTIKSYRDSKDLHGYENTPEFYGMMPFIKI